MAPSTCTQGALSGSSADSHLDCLYLHQLLQSFLGGLGLESVLLLTQHTEPFCLTKKGSWKHQQASEWVTLNQVSLEAWLFNRHSQKRELIYSSLKSN